MKWLTVEPSPIQVPDEVYEQLMAEQSEADENGPLFSWRYTVSPPFGRSGWEFKIAMPFRWVDGAEAAETYESRVSR